MVSSHFQVVYISGKDNREKSGIETLKVVKEAVVMCNYTKFCLPLLKMLLEVLVKDKTLQSVILPCKNFLHIHFFFYSNLVKN